MSYSLRPVNSNLEYPHHKWFKESYGWNERKCSRRKSKKRIKYEWFNEDLFGDMKINFYDDNVFKEKIYLDKENHPDWYFYNKSGNDKRWRLVFRIRKKYLNKNELRDIYKESKDDYIEKYGKDRYI